MRLNKKSIAAIVGALLSILGAVKLYLDQPDAPATPAPSATAVQADAGAR